MEELNINEITELEGALGGVAGVARQAEQALGSLDNKLLTLRLNFGKLRAALERAFAPITSHIAQGLNTLVGHLTDFANGLGAVIGALFGTVQEKAVTTAKKSGKALRRYLADFDEIQRLNAGSGSAGGVTTTWKTITPALTEQTQAVVDAIRAAIAPLQAISLDNARTALAALAQAVKNLAAVIGENLAWAYHNVLLPLLKWTLEEAVPAIANTLTAAFGALSAALGPLFGRIRDSWLAAMTAMSGGVAAAVNAVLTALTGLANFLTGVFTGNWRSAWEGLKTIARGAVNGLIGIVNAMLSSLVGGINGAAKALNNFRVNLPSWLPGVGGKTFGFNLPTLKVPQIPYLAQGAVLPANRPFLAMVGDQRHGTNIEAPLSTIQEAVAMTMEDFASANRAGQEATVAVLQEILAAVLGIELGDTVLGAAANRYNARLGAIRGVI